MATFDISRVAFNPRKHYSSVRMQQGRVLTDDDWNENERIEDEILRRTQVDIIGRSGSPDDGFKIDPGSFSIAGGFMDFDILAGTLYTGGIRFEMDSAEKFRLQKDWLQKNDNDFAVPVFPAGVSEIFDLVYLEGWQQAISAVEDSSLFEVALGGPDTTTRLRNMRRVKIFKNTGSDECPISWKKLRTDWTASHFGTINKEDELIPDSNLKVSFIDSGNADDLCSPSVTGGYLGAENQAIRVQVTDYDPATNKGHFTWGFDDAAPFYRVTVSANGLVVSMITEPKDQYHWPLSGQVVEILPWSAVLPNSEKISEQTGFLTTVALSYNPDTKSFKLNTALPAGFGAQWKNRSDKNDLVRPSEFFYMRVWNRGTDILSPDKIQFITGSPVKLGNTGLQVTFTGDDFIAPDGTTGNYWVIAARPATRQSVVPWELLTTGTSPNGVRFFYSPLAIIKWTQVSGAVQGEIIHDCRKHFHPLTEQECCCTFTVGDGVNSKGDFRSIQDAVNSLPAEGGKICILPGIHEANVVIINRRKIHIYGCGEQSIVRTPPNNSNPIFLIRHSQKIKIDNLTLVSFDGIAILAEDNLPNDPPSSGIIVRDNRILACIHAVRIYLKDDGSGNNNVKIAFNLVGMYDKPTGDVAIFSLADDVLIERNRIVMIPPPKGDPDEPQPDPPGDPFDPCADLKKLYARNKKFRGIIDLSFHFVSLYFPGGNPRSYKAPGGIQIGSGSEKIWILQNEIIGGRGNGITLGHMIGALKMNIDHQEILFSPFIYDLTIEENWIYEMGLSGIGTVFHLSGKQIITRIENLLICENTIRYCVLASANKDHRFIGESELPPAAISLAFCEDCIIRENWLEENGRSQLHTICGIFIFYGEKVDISENRVINNGPDVQPTTGLNKNVRGGIVIWFATKLPGLKRPNATDTGASIALAPIPVLDAVPAVKIHDNIVTQPIGQALFIIAFGPVSVVSNQFTSQGINKKEFYSMRAGTVFIFNLGISKDIFNIFLLPLKHWGFVNPSVYMVVASHSNPAYRAFLNIYQYLPNGKTMYSANQVTLDMRSFEIDVCISSQLLFSLDDIAFVDNQSECAGFVGLLPKPISKFTADFVLFNTLLFSISTRCSDNRFTDGFSYTFFSLLSLALMNTATANQSTHCLIVPYWAFRRKALNIELNILDCSNSVLEDKLSKVNIHSTDKRFNYESV